MDEWLEDTNFRMGRIKKFEFDTVFATFQRGCKIEGPIAVSFFDIRKLKKFAVKD